MTSSVNDAVQTVTKIQNLIDGHQRDAVEGRVFTHPSPAPSGTSVEAVRSGLMDVVQAVQAMNRAQDVWLKLTREERDGALLKTFQTFKSKLEVSGDDLARTLAYDIGMPVRYGLGRSVPAALKLLDATITTFEESRPGARFPATGNTAVLLGWTDPLVNFMRRVPVLLAAGNSVCVKPSSRAPRTVSKISLLLRDAMASGGMPAGLFAVLNGTGTGDDALGEALLTHPGIKKIYWTGRSESAALAQAQALEHGKHFSFTGSGRNPAILFQGFAEPALGQIIDQLARSIVDPHGHGPYRPSRLFIHDSIYKEVLEKLSGRLQTLKCGDPLHPETEVGPLPQREAEAFDAQVKLALSETGRLVTGGHRDQLQPEPTLVRDLTNCSTLQSEELAGPWATAASFKYPHEALKYANTSPLALAAFVLHPDSDKAKLTAQKLESARVFFSAELPWPAAVAKEARAFKQSGNHVDGIDEIFRQSQVTATWLE